MAAILSPGVTHPRPWSSVTNTFMTRLLIEFVTIKTEFIGRNEWVITTRLLPLRMRREQTNNAELFSEQIIFLKSSILTPEQ